MTAQHTSKPYLLSLNFLLFIIYIFDWQKNGGFYMIVRGSTNIPINLGDYKVPSTAKLLQFTNDGIILLHFLLFLLYNIIYYC